MPRKGPKHGDSPAMWFRSGDTPAKAMVRGTISYLESEGLPVNKSAIFRHFNLSRSQGYAALSLPGVSKRGDPKWMETRGRPNKLSKADQQRMEALLWEEDDDREQQHQQQQQLQQGSGDEGMWGVVAVQGDAAGDYNWAKLAKAAGVEVVVNPRTLHRTMGTLGYRKCLSCGHGVVHRRCREKRVDWARRMLEAYPSTSDWRRVRFSVELHFGFGLGGKVRLLPRPGERLQCPMCEGSSAAGVTRTASANAQAAAMTGEMGEWGWEDGRAEAAVAAAREAKNRPRDVKKVHAWAAAGYGFKSGLIFYDDTTNPNWSGTPTMADYHEKILEKEVKSWLAAERAGGPEFMLYEDVEAFAHGGLSKQNMVQSWKDSVGLRHIFSCGDSPDLSPVEALWPKRKQWQFGDDDRGTSSDADKTTKTKEWDDERLKAISRLAWEGVDQESVNIWVDYMVQRLRQVVESEGRLVLW